MGKLETPFQFTGPVGNVSAYRMRGVDKIIIRRKGGASRNQIKNSPAFERTRHQNKEFAGRARGVSWMRSAMKPLLPLADYNVCGPLNKLIKYVQYLDKQSEIGQRNIAFSKHGSLMEGFSLNRDSDLNTLIRVPLTYTISRETLSAKVDIAELVPGRNFFPPTQYPLFAVIAALGAVPDLHYQDNRVEPYKPSQFNFSRSPAEASTEWLRVNEGSPATALELKLKSQPPADDFALVLSLGIAFGIVAPGGSVEMVERAGCAKVVGVSVISNQYSVVSNQ